MPTLKIFISYRREDSAGHAGRIEDRVVARFGAESVFMDVDSIQAGDDYMEILRDRVAACDVLIAVIGPDWVQVTDRAGKRRLDDPADFVRFEVEAALERKVLVIPVLVGGAAPVTADALPAGLQPLTRRHAHEISDTRFRHDVDRLIEVLDRLATTREQTVRPGAPEPGRAGSVADVPSGQGTPLMTLRLSKRWLSALVTVALVLAVGATMYLRSESSRPASGQLQPSGSEAPTARDQPRPTQLVPAPANRAETEVANIRRAGRIYIHVPNEEQNTAMSVVAAALRERGFQVQIERRAAGPKTSELQYFWDADSSTANYLVGYLQGFNCPGVVATYIPRPESTSLQGQFDLLLAPKCQVP